MNLKEYLHILFSSDHPLPMSRAERTLFYASVFLRVVLAFAIAWAAWHQQWFTLFVSSLAFFLCAMPSIIERNYRIHFPIEFEFFVTLFIYASLFLGEIHSYYTRFWWWDLVLHAGSGIGLGLCGFLLLYLLTKEKKLKTSPILTALFIFSFALAMGTLWEIFEFTMDQLFGTSMQKSGLMDTMGDLIVDGLGALVVSVASWVYFKLKKQGFIVSVIKKFRKLNKW
ncbi:hypothetical protein D6774_02750 [Candidatus Woesearchaeota archaeon]|nr:MAG: hypothetical protein D6774_02750 [Candidatus Woesearchaeota archaeon]